MQTSDQLTESFAIPGALAFDQHGELIRARITTAACTADLYLQGAHLATWQPSGQHPVLFLSEKSFFQAGKAIRGGVPLVFPWFGARAATSDNTRTEGPVHGFARTELWQLDFAALTGDDLHFSLSLVPNDRSRSYGFDHFRAAYQLTLGRELRLRFTVANDGASPLQIGEAFHTYFHVGDVEQATVDGLANAEYLDKTENFARKRQAGPLIAFHNETDRLYLNTVATTAIHDPVLRRRITIAKANSHNTVVWNPWSHSGLNDMTSDGWRQMLCVETANASENVLTLHPHEAHVMEATISVADLA